MASPKIKGLTIVIDSDTTKLSEGLKQIRTEASNLKYGLRDVKRLLEMDPSNVDLITKRQGYLNDALDRTKKHLDSLRDAHDKYAGNAENLTRKEKQQWTELQREMARVELQYEELKEEAVDFGLSASAETLSLKATLEETGTALTELGNKLAPVSAATAYLGYSAINAAMEFESSFTGVRKTINATETELQQLSDASREMALTKPIDVNDINYAMELGGQLGIAAENIAAFASVIADLDVATNLDLEDASLKLAQFANIAQIGEDNFDRLGSVIVDLGNNSATTEAKIMNMAMRIAGSGSNIGLSAQNILALATSLASVGIEPEMGGNAISTIMNRIDKDVALATDTLQVWADTAGMSAEAFKAAWSDSDTVMDAMMAVINGMATYRDDGGNLNTLLKDMEISYMRQIDTMQRLSRTGEVVNDMIAIANNAWDQNTALTTEANRRYETAASQIQILKNTVNELAIVMGEEMLPTVKDIVGEASDMVRAFSEMDEETKQAIIKIGLFATAATPALLVVGSMATGLSSLLGLLASGETKFALWRKEVTGTTKDEKKLSVETEKAATKIGLLTKAANIAKGALAGVAIAGIALIVNELLMAIKHADNMEKATKKLSDSMDELDKTFIQSRASIRRMTDSSNDYCGSVDDVGEAVRNAADEQARLADKIHESFREAGESIGTLEGYYEIISDLYGKTNLTAEEQARLATAIDIVNDKCGTSFKVVEDFSGAFVAVGDGAYYAKDAILELIKAQQLQMQYTVNQDAYEEAYSTHLRNSEVLAEAYAAVDYWGKAYDDAQKMTGVSDFEKAIAITNAASEYEKAKIALRDAKELYGESSAEVAELEERIGFLSLAMEDGSGSISRTVADCRTLTASLELTGKSALDFVGDMEDAGVSAEDFATLTEGQLLQLGSAFDGTFASVSGLLEQYGVAVDESSVAAKSSVESMASDIRWFNSEVSVALGKSGISIENFCGALVAAGVSTDDFKNLSVFAIEELISNYDGSTASILATLQTFGEDVKYQADKSGAYIYDGIMSPVESLYYDLPEEARKMLESYDAGFKDGLTPLDERTIEAIDILMKLSADNYDSYDWGLDILKNLLLGLEDGKGPLKDKLIELGELILSFLGHSVPKEGPLHNGGKGEIEWGAHIVQNLIKGMKSEEENLRSAVGSVSSIVSDDLNGFSYSSAIASVGGSGYVPSFMMNPTSGSSTYVTETHNHYSVGNIDYTGDAQVERAVVNLFDALERRANT